MYLILDVGNTNVKVGVFDSQVLIERLTVGSEELQGCLKKLAKRYLFKRGLISSVGKFTESMLIELNEIVPFLILDHKFKFSFENKYATPNTLGVDRIAHAEAVVNIFSDKNVLVIDSGTCLTYDFVNTKGQYLGGAISLGLQTRFKAINYYTAKLPLFDVVDIKESVSLVGSDTKTSIYSGIVNGCSLEVEGVIASYKQRFQDLTVVLTGGGADFLAKQLKSSIFVDSNFVLKGLHAILLNNIK